MAIYVEYSGRRLYLHGNRGRFYYLSYSKEGALDEIPEGYKIAYNSKGLPYVKRVG